MNGLPEELRTCSECVFDLAVRWIPVYGRIVDARPELEGFCLRHGPSREEGWLSKEEAMVWLTMEE